jgi:hypothetical protein
MTQWNNQNRAFKEIKFLGDDGKTFEIKAPEDIKVRELKSMILYTRN